MYPGQRLVCYRSSLSFARYQCTNASPHRRSPFEVFPPMNSKKRGPGGGGLIFPFYFLFLHLFFVAMDLRMCAFGSASGPDLPS